jgi:hypothetical protein
MQGEMGRTAEKTPVACGCMIIKRRCMKCRDYLASNEVGGR